MFFNEKKFLVSDNWVRNMQVFISNPLIYVKSAFLFSRNLVLSFAKVLYSSCMMSMMKEVKNIILSIPQVFLIHVVATIKPWKKLRDRLSNAVMVSKQSCLL